jgi:superfamily I DNA/RNA helicase
MLTFSKFTRDDFINKIKKNKKTLIELKQIKTIDSFAKSIIDCNNEVDISLLSFVFMEYLQNESKDELIKNKKLNNIITIFVDEAQDLNEIQYNILMELKNKLGIYINLIGDPNQNIYQFRNSSDKYLRLFDAKTFYLTKPFRPNKHIISCSKW